MFNIAHPFQLEATKTHTCTIADVDKTRIGPDHMTDWITDWNMDQITDRITAALQAYSNDSPCTLKFRLGYVPSEVGQKFQRIRMTG